jgi:cell division protein FtsN
MELFFGIIIGVVLTIVILFVIGLVTHFMHKSEKCSACDDRQFPGNDDKCPVCRRPRDW